MTKTTEIARVLRNRFINWMRAQPREHELTTAEVSEWLYLPDDSLVDVVLVPAANEGVVKVREVRGGRLWSLA